MASMFMKWRKPDTSLPWSGLDISNRKRVMDSLKQWRRDLQLLRYLNDLRKLTSDILAAMPTQRVRQLVYLAEQKETSALPPELFFHVESHSFTRNSFRGPSKLGHPRGGGGTQPDPPIHPPGPGWVGQLGLPPLSPMGSFSNGLKMRPENRIKNGAKSHQITLHSSKAQLYFSEGMCLFQQSCLRSFHRVAPVCMLKVVRIS